jgi:hypothetical protein
MSKLNQIKIPVELEEIDSRPTPNYKLVREHDGLTKHSGEVTWVEWDEAGYFKDRHPQLEIGRSLLMSPFHPFYFTWQTTPVTEIVEQREDYIKFKTKNSNYELFKL